jgi:hypothetical protein
MPLAPWRTSSTGQQAPATAWRPMLPPQVVQLLLLVLQYRRALPQQQLQQRSQQQLQQQLAQGQQQQEAWPYQVAGRGMVLQPALLPPQMVGRGWRRTGPWRWAGVASWHPRRGRQNLSPQGAAALKLSCSCRWEDAVGCLQGCSEGAWQLTGVQHSHRVVAPGTMHVHAAPPLPSMLATCCMLLFCMPLTGGLSQPAQHVYWICANNKTCNMLNVLKMLKVT